MNPNKSLSFQRPPYEHASIWLKEPQQLIHLNILRREQSIQYFFGNWEENVAIFPNSSQDQEKDQNLT